MLTQKIRRRAGYLKKNDMFLVVRKKKKRERQQDTDVCYCNSSKTGSLCRPRKDQQAASPVPAGQTFDSTGSFPAVSWISDDVLNISAILLSSLEPKMYNLTDRL